MAKQITDRVGVPLTEGTKVRVVSTGAEGVVEGPTAGRTTLVDVWIYGSRLSFYGRSLMAL